MIFRSTCDEDPTTYDLRSLCLASVFPIEATDLFALPLVPTHHQNARTSQ